MSWTPLGPPLPLPPSAPPPLPVAFSGDRSEFFHLVKRGAGLELITLGFYRFWLATDMRRHLWSNTHVDGDAAEYTGRARELLIGFLVALAILVPVYLAYFLVGLEAERAQAFASFPLFAFFYLFGQFAIFRARRYRLTRTVWRGVRFWMSGSGWLPAKPMGELMFRVTGKEGNKGLSIASGHPVTEDRLARMSQTDRPASGPPLLTAEEWRSLKAICSANPWP
jgi:uncharacterized membrane protein YjgN (DUF898 family)